MDARCFTIPDAARAAIFTGAGRPLELQRLPIPSPAAGEALVRVDCCTLCGSDLHTVRGARIEPTPSILGHEILGTVVAVGAPAPNDVAGEPIEPGDRITWSTAVSCGECDRCRAGLPQKCRSLTKYGHERAEGRTALAGGLAEYLLLRRGSAVVRLPERVADEVLCPANCAAATVAAAYRVAGGATGKRVLIFGAGMLGLTAAAWAKSNEATTVVLCDRDESRLARSGEFGAGAGVPWTDDGDELRDRIEQATGQEEFDLVLELAGSPDAVEAACRLAAIAATVVLIGTVSPTRPVALDPERIVRRWLSIRGVHNYAPIDLQSAVSFLGENHGAFPFAELATRSFALEDVNSAVEAALGERPPRIVVRPHDRS